MSQIASFYLLKDGRRRELSPAEVQAAVENWRAIRFAEEQQVPILLDF